MVKTFVKWGLIGLTAVIVAGLFIHSCRLYDQNSLLKGRLDELVRITDADHAILITEISAQNAIIKLKTGEIADLLAKADKPTEAEKEKDKIIADREKEIAKLKAKGDYKGAFEQAEAEIKDWSTRFTLAEERYKRDLFDLNDKWAVKFNAEVVISDGWKKDRDGEHTLRLLGEKRIKGLEGSLRWSRFWKTGTTILAIAGGGYIAYDLIKGK